MPNQPVARGLMAGEPDTPLDGKDDDISNISTAQ